MSTPFANAAMRAGQAMLRRAADAQASLNGGPLVGVIFKAEADMSNLGLADVAATETYLIGMAADLPGAAYKVPVSVQSAPRSIPPTPYIIRRVVPRNQLGQTLLVLEKP